MSEHPRLKSSTLTAPGRLENESFITYSDLCNTALSNNGLNDDNAYNIYDDEQENNILIKVIFVIRMIIMFSI